MGIDQQISRYPTIRIQDLDINGRRVGDTLRLACNRDSTGLAGVFGEGPDWPVSDHFGRHVWSLHVHERQERPHGEREWWVRGGWILK